MSREWRHLKMMKRSGRGHDPHGGVAETSQGECAVLCPACPQPGKNMMLGWKDAPDDKQFGGLSFSLSNVLLIIFIFSFLHALFLAIDANFRLKRKNISSQCIDPGLSQGFAYFVEETAYKEHLAKYKDEVEPVKFPLSATYVIHMLISCSEKYLLQT